MVYRHRDNYIYKLVVSYILIPPVMVTYKIIPILSVRGMEM